jgi:predicted DCC family thiol-disulfide oxidoreductase YuxK
MVDVVKPWQKQPGITIVYDGECPFCNSYTKLVRLRDSVGPVTLIDARERPDIVADAKQLGLNVNEGMLVVHQSQIFVGDEAMTFLSAFSSRSGILNQMMSWVFSDPRRSRALYPALRCGRNLILSILGRSQIDPKAID